MGRGGKEAERDEEKKGQESGSTQRDPSAEARSLHRERRGGRSHTHRPTPSTYLGCLKAIRHRSYFPTMLQAMTRPSAPPETRCHSLKNRHFTAPSCPVRVCKKRRHSFQTLSVRTVTPPLARAGGFFG